MMGDYSKHSPCLWLMPDFSVPGHHINQECYSPQLPTPYIPSYTTWLFRLPGGSSGERLYFINERDEVTWDKSSLVRGLELKIKLPESTFIYFTFCFPDLNEDDKLIPQDKQEYVNREGTDFCRARLLLQTSHKCHQHRPCVVVILFKFILLS